MNRAFEASLGHERLDQVALIARWKEAAELHVMTPCPDLLFEPALSLGS